MAAQPAEKLRFYDTYTRGKRAFTPIDPANVRMYVCGPTVYDYAHIGNARPVIVFDVLFRLLRHIYGADHVTYVRNITDVDDKINARAARDYPGLPLNEAIRKVTEKTAEQFEKDAAALGCLAPSFEPRATENIGQMQEMIAALIAKGHAYEAAGEVLFDTASMPAYGGLSQRNLDEQQAGARVDVAAHKRNPADFVLWKQSSAGEPGWDSPWGRGRPGWHIECSAMSERYLWTEMQERLSGKAKARPHQFDIHGGGLDLIFPHHENEIAQSCCAHGTARMANFWMHNGFLQVEGQKMSKSLGNFVTIHDLLETKRFGGRKWPGEVLRLAMLMTHYREPIDFSLARLEEAERLINNWRREIVKKGVSFAEKDRAATEAERVCSKVVAGLSNDLNMSEVLAALHWHAGGNESYNGPRLYGSLQFLGVLSFDNMVAWIDAEKAVVQDVDSAAMEQAVTTRLQALAAKDFAKADAIRAELLAEGVQLMDYKDPETGERRTKWEVKR